MYSSGIPLKEVLNKMVGTFFVLVFASSLPSTQVQDPHLFERCGQCCLLQQTSWHEHYWVLIPALEMKNLQSRMYYSLPMSTLHYALCWKKIHLMTHFTNYISFPLFLFIYVIRLCKSLSKRRHRLLRGQLRV